MATSRLLAEPCTEMVGFWLEPAWHVLEMTSDGNGTASITFWHRTGDNRRDAEAKAVARMETRKLCRLLLNRLRSLHAATGTDRFHAPDCWGKVFPDDAISCVFTRIRSQKVR
ncbi:hypothetical protein [Rhodopirellula europaea]|nr:hypothetical protein [Rhodopirellula europaea]